jgi:hypothetical protein
MLHNVVLHTFSPRSVRGWSCASPLAVDVMAVVDARVYKRWFRIFNRSHPYSLCIQVVLDRPRTSLVTTPTTDWSLAWGYKTETEERITRRYMTLQEAQAEAGAILGARQRTVHKLRELLLDQERAR